MEGLSAMAIDEVIGSVLVTVQLCWQADDEGAGALLVQVLAE